MMFRVLLKEELFKELIIPVSQILYVFSIYHEMGLKDFYLFFTNSK